MTDNSDYTMKYRDVDGELLPFVDFDNDPPPDGYFERQILGMLQQAQEQSIPPRYVLRPGRLPFAAMVRGG